MDGRFAGGSPSWLSAKNSRARARLHSVARNVDKISIYAAGSMAAKTIFEDDAS
jgi:hypothetical protein